MIIIKDYGVELHQLTRDKIELVRQWRNSEKVKQYMEFRGDISKEMQKRWFDNVSSSDSQFYFLIVVDGREVGLINIKNIDWTTRIGESGIFIFEDDCLHAGVSYRAAMCQRDFAFGVLHLEKLQAHILNTNQRSIKYNKKFGFKLSDLENSSVSVETNQLYLLDKISYYNNKNNIISMLKDRYNYTPPKKAFRGFNYQYVSLNSMAA